LSAFSKATTGTSQSNTRRRPPPEAARGTGRTAGHRSSRRRRTACPATYLDPCGQAKAHSIHEGATRTMEPAAVQRVAPLPRFSRVGLQPAQTRPPRRPDRKRNAQPAHRANPPTREWKGWPSMSPTSPYSREAGGAAIRRPQPDPLPSPARAATSITHTLVTRVIDHAAWKRLRRAPAGGDWFGGRSLWTWDEAARSERRWTA
jgi:hypothetical protein